MTINIGIVGTGFVADKRAQALLKDDRVKLRLVAGNKEENVSKFAQKYSLEKTQSWQALVENPSLDLIFVSNINRDHGLVVKAALENKKQVVVEYPLSLDPQQAKELVELASKEGLMLHVEHIELLGGVHQIVKKYLPEIGKVFFARYVTINPQNPVGQRWTYNQELFGFPLVGALSRIHRLRDLFGLPVNVSCLDRYWWSKEENQQSPYYRSCLCHTQLNFKDNLIAEVVYGKGETFWQSARTLEIYGEEGMLCFEGEKGYLLKQGKKIDLDAPERAGLIAQDTMLVLNHILQEQPLYLEVQESLYSLDVADLARQSAQKGQTLYL